MEWGIYSEQYRKQGPVTMIFLVISFIAGILTVLAPCILPLLPIIISSTEGAKKGISKRAITVISSLAVSVIVFTLLLKASTLLIDIPQSFWAGFSGTAIILVGLSMIFPTMWGKIPLVNKLSRASNSSLGKGYQKKSYVGDVVIGLSLGPVFSTCSPTYLFIIATVLPAGFLLGFVYLLAFVLGLVVSLLAIAYFGEQLVGKFTANPKRSETVKKVFGVLLLIVGIGIFTGYDKKLETWILDSGYGATINFEETLIDRFAPSDDENSQSRNSGVPSHLEQAFPDTDWLQSIDDLSKIANGGPGRDGIPAIDNPLFIKSDEYTSSDFIQAMVMIGESEVKAYPYNILNWHEIVNDTIDGRPVAVTFCPLCGSAIAFDRTLPNGVVSTFGVSGSLLESNMIMFDRETETLWQQSTGRAIAGDFFDDKLKLVDVELLTMKEVIERYPEVQILSEDTGFRRDYARNPYSGYEESEDFIFELSSIDTRLPSKTIIAAFRLNEIPVAFEWVNLPDGEYVETINGEEVEIIKEFGQVTINASGQEIPTYFEMWFSWAVQNPEGEFIIPK